MIYGCGAAICLAAQPSTVFGSPDVMVVRGVSETLAVTGALADAIVAAVRGESTAKGITSAINGSAKRFGTGKIEKPVRRELLHAALLGALDAWHEAETDRFIPVESFAAPRSGYLLAGSGRDTRFAARPLDDAIKAFLAKEPVTRDVFDQMEKAAQRRAFTVAKAANEAMVRVVKQELVRQLAVGADLRDFGKHAAARFESAGWTPANPSHVETVFRTNVIGAYSGGRIRQMTQPEVLNVRPFWESMPVGDGPPRQRKTHRNFVLRASDPFWQTAAPPYGYNCRCRLRSLSLKQGAGRVQEGTSIHGLPDEGFTSGTAALFAGEAQPDRTAPANDAPPSQRPANDPSPSPITPDAAEIEKKTFPVFDEDGNETNLVIDEDGVITEKAPAKKVAPKPKPAPKPKKAPEPKTPPQAEPPAAKLKITDGHALTAGTKAKFSLEGPEHSCTREMVAALDRVGFREFHAKIPGHLQLTNKTSTFALDKSGKASEVLRGMTTTLEDNSMPDGVAGYYDKTNSLLRVTTRPSLFRAIETEIPHTIDTTRRVEKENFKGEKTKVPTGLPGHVGWVAKTKEANAASVAVHEFGHAIHLANPNSPTTVLVNRAILTEYHRHGKAREAVSVYGDENEKEFFAEAFSAYWHYPPGWMKRNTPRMLKMVEDVLELRGLPLNPAV
jgi:hypothetical protein